MELFPKMEGCIIKMNCKIPTNNKGGIQREMIKNDKISKIIFTIIKVCNYSFWDTEGRVDENNNHFMQYQKSLFLMCNYCYHITSFISSKNILELKI